MIWFGNSADSHTNRLRLCELDYPNEQMKPQSRLLVISVSLAFLLSQSMLRSEEAPTVRLAPFIVFGNLFTFNYGVTDGIVAYAKISEVTPTAKMMYSGLRPGDTMVSINGRTIVGMKREEFESVLKLEPEPGRPKTIRFLRKRGFLGLEKALVDLTFTANPDTSKSKHQSEQLLQAVH